MERKMPVKRLTLLLSASSTKHVLLNRIKALSIVIFHKNDEKILACPKSHIGGQSLLFFS